MEKLAENDLTYFYLRHVVIVVTTVTTISLTSVNGTISYIYIIEGNYVRMKFIKENNVGYVYISGVGFIFTFKICSAFTMEGVGGEINHGQL